MSCGVKSYPEKDASHGKAYSPSKPRGDSAVQVIPKPQADCKRDPICGRAGRRNRELIPRRCRQARPIGSLFAKPGLPTLAWKCPFGNDEEHSLGPVQQHEEIG